MNATAKSTVALLGSAALVGGAVVALPALSDQNNAAPLSSAISQSAEANAGAGFNQAAAQGSFSFTQDKVASTGFLARVFSKAAGICASLADYEVAGDALPITISGPAGQMNATVDDLGAVAGGALLILACACASNLAGGNAVANAQVEGVELAQIAALASAR